mmetsp:Transcript_733/g.1655  ORF Transcript_733/g.1655 Transcript_733/m.1655 type:complete len:110 (-) Transcript_733:36-365(-)
MVAAFGSNVDFEREYSSSALRLRGGYKGQDKEFRRKYSKLPKCKKIGARWRYKEKTARLWTKKGYTRNIHVRPRKPPTLGRHLGAGEWRPDRLSKLQILKKRAKSRRIY